MDLNEQVNITKVENGFIVSTAIGHLIFTRMYAVLCWLEAHDSELKVEAQPAVDEYDDIPF